MARALDHIVWPARDLDGLAETFRRLGFTVGRRNRHPWGTVNHIIQFDGCFLELLGFADDYRAPDAEDSAFPFAGFCEAALDRAPVGAAMLVLRSDDAEADAQRFAAAGLGRGQMLPFSRAAQGPDGSDRTVAFTIAFADLPGTPPLGAFTCQQHRPENFWNPAAQQHPNGATGIAALTIAAAEPAERTRSLVRLAAAQADPHDASRLQLGDGCLVEVVSLPQDQTTSPVIAAISVRVVDLARAASILDAAAIPFTTSETSLAVAGEAAGGTALRFVQPRPR